MRNLRNVAPIALCLGLFSLPALAQQESAAAALGGPQPTVTPPASAAPAGSNEPPEEVVVNATKSKSPEWSQTRQYTQTRFWRLDKYEQQFELWYTGRFAHDGIGGQGQSKSAAEHLWQVEYMVSLIKGIQLDVYFNFEKDVNEGYGAAHIQGAQIETRIAPWDYGQLFLNPALYLEWHPQNGGANRGEARILLGGNITSRLRGAVNPFFEFNLDKGGPPGAGTKYLPEIETGASGGLSYMATDIIGVGGEVKYASEQQGSDEHALQGKGYAGFGESHFYQVLKIGPAAWLRLSERHMYLTGALMFGATKFSDHELVSLILSYIP